MPLPPDDQPLMPSRLLTESVSYLVGEDLIPQRLQWSDSANWIWVGKANQKIFKLAREESAAGRFWLGLAALFNFDRFTSATTIPDRRQELPSHLPIKLINLTFEGRVESAPLWSMPYLADAQQVSASESFAAALGEQIGRLHASKFAYLSSNGEPLELSKWPELAIAWLKQCGYDENHPSLATSFPEPSCVVWCLPDIRFDQFLQSDGFYCCDWEALVIAPIEFDLCIIELLLQSRVEQEAFLTHYQMFTQLCELGEFRYGMRLLIDSLNLHGEEGYAWLFEFPAWLDQATGTQQV